MIRSLRLILLKKCYWKSKSVFILVIVARNSMRQKIIAAPDDRVHWILTVMCFIRVSCEDELSPSATIAEGSDTLVTVRASFCGSWYEEALASCSSRSPCKDAATDCPEHAGCFSDINCQFSESSPEYKDFLASLKELDEVKDTSSNNDDDGKHSNLRPRPSSSTLDAARNDSSVSSYHVYTAVVSVIPFAWILGV